MTEGVCIGKRRQSVPAGRESAGMSRIRESSGRVRPVGNKEIMAAGLLYMHRGRELVDTRNGERAVLPSRGGNVESRTQFRAQRKRANNDVRVCARGRYRCVISGCKRFVRLT